MKICQMPVICTKMFRVRAWIDGRGLRSSFRKEDQAIMDISSPIPKKRSSLRISRKGVNNTWKRELTLLFKQLDVSKEIVDELNDDDRLMLGRVGVLLVVEVK